MVYIVHEGTKALMKGSQLTLKCRSDEVDAAYDILAEELVLKDQNNEQDLIDF